MLPLIAGRSRIVLLIGAASLVGAGLYGLSDRWPVDTGATGAVSVPSALHLPAACARHDRVGEAACRVYQEATQYLIAVATEPKSFVRGLATSLPPSEELFPVLALAAVDYVQSHVSTALFLCQSLSPDFLPPIGAEEALDRAVGLCGNHVAVFESIMRALDVPVRATQLFYRNSSGDRVSHIVAEVKWNDRWHLFDVTWGAYFPSPRHSNRTIDPLPLSDVLGTRAVPTFNPNNLNIRSWLAMGANPFAYQTAPDLSSTVDGVGEIRVDMSGRAEGPVVEDFQHIPNFVGFNRPDAKAGGGTWFQFRGLSGTYDVTVDVAGTGCEGTGQLVLDGVIAEARTGRITFADVPSPRHLSLRSTANVCYLVMKSMVFARHPASSE